MDEVEIEEITIDQAGGLLVRPRTPRDENLSQVYRAAMGVNWDAVRVTCAGATRSMDRHRASPNANARSSV
jgi:hypothetical protein